MPKTAHAFRWQSLKLLVCPWLGLLHTLPTSNVLTYSNAGTPRQQPRRASHSAGNMSSAHILLWHCFGMPAGAGMIQSRKKNTTNPNGHFDLQPWANLQKAKHSSIPKYKHNLTTKLNPNHAYKIISTKKNTAYKKIETRPNSIHSHLLQNDQAFMLITQKKLVAYKMDACYKLTTTWWYFPTKTALQTPL